MLEPTNQQLSALKNIHGHFALVQFLAVQEQAEFEQYLSASADAVLDTGGQRTHHLNIDQYLAGGDMHYQFITVEIFHSSEAAQNAFEAVKRERQSALVDIYALILRPAGRLPIIVKAMRFLAPLLSRRLGTTKEREMTGFAELANPETGPVPGTIAVMREHEQMEHFYMMNLNKYCPRAQYKNGENIS